MTETMKTNDWSKGWRQPYSGGGCASLLNFAQAERSLGLSSTRIHHWALPFVQTDGRNEQAPEKRKWKMKAGLTSGGITTVVRRSAMYLDVEEGESPNVAAEMSQLEFHVKFL